MRARCWVSTPSKTVKVLHLTHLVCRNNVMDVSLHQTFAASQSFVLTASAFILFGEIVLIVLQAARAVPSHFNVSGSLNAAIWSTMGVLITGLYIVNLIGFALYLFSSHPDRTLAEHETGNVDYAGWVRRRVFDDESNCRATRAHAKRRACCDGWRTHRWRGGWWRRVAVGGVEHALRRFARRALCWLTDCKHWRSLVLDSFCSRGARTIVSLKPIACYSSPARSLRILDLYCS